MSIPAIDQTTYSANPAPTAKNTLDMNTFIQLLVTQLQNQDPTSPMSDSEFFSQISQLTQVQGLQTLNQNSSIQTGQAMIGQTVTATNPNAGTGPGQASTVTGTATNVSVKSGVVNITIMQADGTTATVPLSDVQSSVPTTNLTNLASLIGKNVSGPAQVTANGTTTTQEMVGTVIGTSNVNGVAMLEVQTKDKQLVQIPANSVDNISN